jgi:hypothetical protein
MIPDTVLKGLLVLALLGFIMFSSYITDEIGQAHYSIKRTESKIFDFIHEITPDLQAYEKLVNVIPVLLLAVLIFVPGKIWLVEEFFAKLLLIFFIRALTIFTTVLPKHEKCNRRFTWKNCFTGQCYDKVFSGHTAFVFLLSLLLLREKILSFWMFAIINLVEITIILLTRSHYTIDVILALVITYIVHDGDYRVFRNFLSKI